MDLDSVQRTVAELRAALAGAGPFDRERISRDLLEALQAAIAFRRGRFARIEASISMASVSRGAGASVEPADLLTRRILISELAILEELQRQAQADVQAAAAARAAVGPGPDRFRFRGAPVAEPGAAAAVPFGALNRRRPREEDSDEDDGEDRGAARMRGPDMSEERKLEALALFAQNRPEGEKLLAVSADLAATLRNRGLPPLPPELQRRLIGATILDRRMGSRDRNRSLLTPEQMERLFEERFFRPGVLMTSNNNAAIRHCASHGYVRCVQLLLRNADVDPSANDFEALEWAANSAVLRLLLADKRTATWSPSEDTRDRMIRRLVDIERGGYLPEHYEEGIVDFYVGSLLEPRERLRGRDEDALRNIEDATIRDHIEMYRLLSERFLVMNPDQPETFFNFPQSLTTLCARTSLVRTIRILLTEYGAEVQDVLNSFTSFSVLQLVMELGMGEDWIPTDLQFMRILLLFDEHEDEDPEDEEDHLQIIRDFQRRRGETALSVSMLVRLGFEQIPYALIQFAVSQPSFDVNAGVGGESFFVNCLETEDFASARVLSADPRFLWTAEDVAKVLDLLAYARNDVGTDDALIEIAEAMIQTEQARPFLIMQFRDFVLEWLDTGASQPQALVQALLTGRFVEEHEEDSGDDSASEQTYLYSLQLENRLELRPDDDVLDVVLTYVRAVVQEHKTDERGSNQWIFHVARADRVVQFWRWAGKTDEDINALLLAERVDFFFVQRLFQFFWSR
jgi:hypothetical protein